MKIVQDKSDKAYFLGKAARYCKNIEAIFDSLEWNSPDLEEAFIIIHQEIDRSLGALGPSSSHAFLIHKDNK
jgi:hypothetical protein